MVPPNARQGRITEAAGDMLFVTQLGLLVVEARGVAVLSSEDQASCFINQYAMPACWRPSMALGRP
eukprot:1583479-Lingulodinium_polyedra.AAC.1